MDAFFNHCLPVAFRLKTMLVQVSVRELFHRIVANLPQNATGLVRIFKTFQNWCFLEKKMFFSKRKLVFFSKIARSGKFLYNASQMVFLKKFPIYLWGFLTKSHKNFKTGKLGKYGKETECLGKNALIFWEDILTKIGKCRWYLAVLMVVISKKLTLRSSFTTMFFEILTTWSPTQHQEREKHG